MVSTEQIEVIRGFIQATKLDANAEEDEDDDDVIEEDEFMEMEDIRAAVEGAFASRATHLPNRKVLFRNQATGKCFEVTGVFLFTDPWWEIEVDIFKTSYKSKMVKLMPRYAIKQSWKKQDVIMYLKGSGISVDLSHTAWEMIKTAYNKGEDGEFTVQEILQLPNLGSKFDGVLGMQKEKTTVLKNLERHLPLSGITILIERALSFPRLFWSLQSILPLKAYNILSYGTEPPAEEKETFLSRSNSPDFHGLNDAIENAPWKFAFNYLRVLYKEYNLCGCEAKLSDLQKSGLFDGLEDIKKDSIIVYDKLKKWCRRGGHTLSYYPSRTQSLLFHTCKDKSETLSFLCSDSIRATRNESRETTGRGQPALYLRRSWEAESSIAEQLNTIAKEETGHVMIELPQLHEKDWWELDDRQRKALKFIRTKPLTVISGMGGCGKTTVVAKLVKKYIQSVGREKDVYITKELDTDGEKSVKTNGSILLTAPTGKGATVLGEKCGIDSHTIHKVIYSHASWKKKKNSTKQDNLPWGFVKTKVLVVDECSMVSVTTIARLLDILLKNSKLSKLVLIGDIRQLPSVEPGNFFEDVFKVASEDDLAVELDINHRVDPGGKVIAENACRISKRETPQFCEVTPSLPLLKDSRFIFLKVDDAGNSVNTLALLGELLKSKCEDVEDDTTSQIITFTRKLVDKVNTLCRDHYNPSSSQNNNKRESFSIGDKICCRKTCEIREEEYNRPRGGSRRKNGDGNTQVGGHPNKDVQQLTAEQALKLVLDGPSEEGGESAESERSSGVDASGERLQSSLVDPDIDASGAGAGLDNDPMTVQHEADSDVDENENVGLTDEIELEGAEYHKIRNGDTFKIEDMKTVLDDSSSTEVAYLKNMDGEKFSLDFKSFCKSGKVQHAWCRTIHTFQGSEVNTVVYLLSGARPETWKHVYTAVTRGRKKVIIIGREKDLQKAINTDHKRNTGLYWFLRSALRKRAGDQMAAQPSSKAIKS